MQIYRFTLHMAMSISHRITGLALVVGTLLVLYWLASAAHGPEAYTAAAGVLGSWLGLLLIFGWSVALFYHLCNGIRHLFWDAGQLFEIPQIRTSGLVVLGATATLTVLAWVLGLSI
jgi:succinate dehydrogenase / fumarate reductase cytochrome b subunit